MKTIQLKDLPKGAMFKRKISAHDTYVRGTYDRTTKRFDCTSWFDIGKWMQLRGTTIVFVDFEF